ncbi:Glyoxalase/bleomycin resistance protein/dioxygenase [Oscillatoria nigro-viridis PCC 7112]|uniref:Glyoxalase/bleomycin resistance protein/dioxygenase n=1 Tax=Phormidium nigroviride PCC 7112 TaxID=179408 RepID=K9VB77_9CYAN|nr:VOC family protein [Oscillatoria nigro-viridis]AFZ05091.1 Glyoxalase/bleomycin resistance protein/dioxygenase [Oscillatoria nigro-viridis PCC 7112]
MQSNIYLFFDGECEAAFKFYEQCLGGKLDGMMTYGDAPVSEEIPSEQRDRIMHANLTVGGMVLMGSDTPPDGFKKPQGFSVNLQFDDRVEAERIFQKLAENGTVKMPFQETFWSTRFGMLVDRFGTPWMINVQPAT